MELRNIKSFIKVAEFENFSKAAEVLGYAQSTITLQIQQLEQELGVNLFDRIGKRVLLSEKGRAFLSYANDMVQLEAEAIETVSENTTPTGTLRIGTIESIASSFLPLLLEEDLKKCPQVHLDIIIGVTLDRFPCRSPRLSPYPENRIFSPGCRSFYRLCGASSGESKKRTT